MAAFPILSLAIGAGGVTAGGFWRLQLLLPVTVFLAAAVGLWSSTRSQGDQEALLRASALVAALTLLPALACLLSLVQTWPSPSPGVAVVRRLDLPALARFEGDDCRRPGGAQHGRSGSDSRTFVRRQQAVRLAILQAEPECVSVRS